MRLNGELNSRVAREFELRGLCGITKYGNRVVNVFIQ